MLRSPAVCLGVHRRHAHGGFTLVELLLVIALISVLAGLALGAMAGARQRAATARARAELALLSQALAHYRQRYGDYPQRADAPEEFFAALAGRVGPTGSAIRGPNLTEGLGVTCRSPEPPDGASYFVDPWDNPYQYVYFTRLAGAGGMERGYVLYSAGARSAAEALPSRADVVPFTSGPQGGAVARSTLNAKNLYAGP
jgi:prepilin-type N-terminal cleavage/methylation domain-containing protein